MHEALAFNGAALKTCVLACMRVSVCMRVRMHACLYACVQAARVATLLQDAERLAALADGRLQAPLHPDQQQQDGREGAAGQGSEAAQSSQQDGSSVQAGDSSHPAQAAQQASPGSSGAVGGDGKGGDHANGHATPQDGDAAHDAAGGGSLLDDVDD